jgi:hypothetical protein
MRNAYSIFVGKLERRGHSENLGVDGKIILEWILREIVWEVMGWIHLAQDSDQWRPLVNTVMNLRIP